MDSQHIRKNLIEAWERYVNDSCTYNDVALILESIKDDDYIQEFTEVFNQVVWNRAMNDLPPTPEEKEIYRKKAAQLLAEYESNQKAQTIPVACGEPFKAPSRNNIGSRFRRIWYAAAAVLLLGLLMPAVYLYVKPKAEQTAVQYVEESTQRGEIRIVVLPDLTEVTLNAASCIKYPANFTGDERSVELYGEALFDVTSDPARPFTVKAENMNIRVVGTVFGVKAYADDMLSSVAVASGKVEVAFADEKVMLEQNQQATMNKTTKDIETMTIDAGKYLSWTDGTLYFYRTPVREVVNILNRHYPQVDIELAEGEYALLISGEHDNRRIEAVLRSIIYSTGLKCEKTENKYILYK